MKHNNQDTPLQATFIHSLFRSGSTFFYNALKRTGLYHVYHEPIHEIIATLSTNWCDITGRRGELKEKLRHNFLLGGYFDEYEHLLPEIKKTFHPRLSFERFFLDQETNEPELKTYLDTLIRGSLQSPVLQCTRTVGRVHWLKANYASKHVFLLRNPWDQWYSYKVDTYIAATPRIIYSQPNLPSVLQDIMKLSGFLPLPGKDILSKLTYSYEHPISPKADYCLFFGLWLYAYITGRSACDFVVDMDEITINTQYRKQVEQSLSGVTLASIKLDDVLMHRTIFMECEMNFYHIIEDQVFEVFQKYTTNVGALQAGSEYLNRQRSLAFISHPTNKSHFSSLEDAKRMRELLLTTGQHNGVLVASLNEAVAEQDGQIASLNEAVAERDGQISSLTDETVRRGQWALRLDADLKEERTRLLAFTRSNSWRLTLPLREGRLWASSPRQQAKKYAKASLRLSKRMYQSLPLSHQTKATHRNVLAKYFPKLLLLNGNHSTTIPILNLSAQKQAIPERFADPADFAKKIEIHVSPNPLVSVIVPVYGKVDYTLRCLASIAANLPQAKFEVIVVDDCSPDNSVEILTNINGICLICNEKNQGFIRSSNIGAKVAQGKYLYFLNNDTEVTSGWMDALVCTFHQFPGTGLTGSKLVYPDGRLQEAGGIIWQDGSVWNFGRFQDPLIPVYNYAREVDYCSGASIMVVRTLFEELGGFDEYYLPAYCEDSDLALKIRDKGYRVIYQPLSTVIHHEGVTSGTDTSQGVKAYQVENSKKLFERWKGYLRTHQPAGVDVDKAKDRSPTRRALVIDHCTPMPNQDAGSVTVFNLLLLLREMDFQVTFIPEDNFLYIHEYTTELQRAGVEVLYAPYIMSVKQHLEESGQRYDLVLLFRPVVVERQISTVRKYCSKAKVLFHTIDLHFLRMSREAELQSDKAKQKIADSMKQRELAAIRLSDASIVHSTAELELLRSELPDVMLHVFPLVMDIQGTSKTFEGRRDIVFVGGYQHTPNVDAVQYFVAEIMPLLRQRLSGVRFYAVGSNPPAEIESLACEDVIITGFIENLTPLLDKMRVSVAPLRYGAGIKGKIGSAMAVGLPVVATPLAAEGMSLIDGQNILVATSAERFSDAIVKLYQDESLWNRISINGLEFAENTWGDEAAWKNLAEILCELGLGSVRNTRPLTLYRPILTNASVTQNGKSNLTDSVVNANYQKKIQQELAIYEKQVNVHDLPKIYHYWSNKYLVPIFQEAGFKTIEEFFTQNLLSAKNRTKSSISRFVSIGSGNCDVEVAIAKSMLQGGCRNFIFECLELNPVMLDRGLKISEQNGVLEFMRFVEGDFNTWMPTAIYDGVIANQSLHHVTELEHLFEAVKKKLHHKGAFIISDMIGRNGHQRWPESLDIVNRFWKELPNKHKFNVLLNRHEEEYENWDCSKEGFEGIRAQDILPLLIEMFHCDKFIGFGSAIDIFVDRCFGHNFNPLEQWDMNFIDRVHQADEEGLRCGKLTPTHMLAVMVKYPVTDPYYSRGLSPNLCTRKSNE